MKRKKKNSEVTSDELKRVSWPRGFCNKNKNLQVIDGLQTQTRVTPVSFIRFSVRVDEFCVRPNSQPEKFSRVVTVDTEVSTHYI